MSNTVWDQTYQAGWQYNVRAHADNPGCNNTVQFGDTVNGIPSGFSQVQTTLPVVCPFANAIADAGASVTFDTGGPFSAVVTANGVVNAFPPPTGRSHASASSSSEVRVQSGKITDSGKITWGPTFSVISQGSTSRSAGKDPILFTATDLVTNQTIQGTLLDIEVEISGDGSMSWENGLFSVDTFNGSLFVDISSPFTLQKGAIALQIENGFVTRADDSGLFDGTLPTVGSPGVFQTMLGDITLDYDFGFGDHDTALMLTFANGGSADVEAVPETSSLPLLAAGVVMLGLLGFMARHRRGARARTSSPERG